MNSPNQDFVLIKLLIRIQDFQAWLSQYEREEVKRSKSKYQFTRIRRQTWRRPRMTNLIQASSTWTLCTSVWVSAASKSPTSARRWITLVTYMICSYHLQESWQPYPQVDQFRKVSFQTMIFDGQSSNNQLTAELTRSVTQIAINMFQKLATVASMRTFPIMITSPMRTMIPHPLNSMMPTNSWSRNIRA